MRVQDEINLHNKKKGIQCKLNRRGVIDLIRTTSNINFTRPTTFGRRHHTPPYIILYASPWRLHLNVIFLWDSQNWDFCCPKTLNIHIFFKSNQFWEYEGNILYPSKRSFPKVHNMPQSELIWTLLSKGLWSGIKFPIWLLPLANQVQMNNAKEL